MQDPNPATAGSAMFELCPLAQKRQRPYGRTRAPCRLRLRPCFTQLLLFSVSPCVQIVLARNGTRPFASSRAFAGRSRVSARRAVTSCATHEPRARNCASAQGLRRVNQGASFVSGEYMQTKVGVALKPHAAQRRLFRRAERPRNILLLGHFCRFTPPTVAWPLRSARARRALDRARLFRAHALGNSLRARRARRCRSRSGPAAGSDGMTIA